MACITYLETHVNHLVNSHLSSVGAAALEIAVLRRDHDPGREVLVNHAHVKIGRAHVHIALVQQVRARPEVRNKLGELRSLRWVALPVAANNGLAQGHGHVSACSWPRSTLAAGPSRSVGGAAAQAGRDCRGCPGETYRLHVHCMSRHDDEQSDGCQRQQCALVEHFRCGDAADGRARACAVGQSRCCSRRRPPFAGGGGTLGGLSDVDISGGLQNGMVLVYNSSAAKWEATLELTPGATQNLDINGGNF